MRHLYLNTSTYHCGHDYCCAGYYRFLGLNRAPLPGSGVAGLLRVLIGSASADRIKIPDFDGHEGSRGGGGSKKKSLCWVMGQQDI